MQIGLIFARGTNGAFGLRGALPWRLKEDMQHFANTTKNAGVIMGRRTWESLPEQVRPLSGRLNLVVTTKRNKFVAEPEKHLFFPQDVKAGIYTAALKKAPRCWIIGGSDLIQQHQNLATVAIVTEVDYTGPFSVSAPRLNPCWKLDSIVEGDALAMEEAGLKYRFKTYRRNP